eukprot:19186-Heterococcus_DN1.PRE.1
MQFKTSARNEAVQTPPVSLIVFFLVHSSRELESINVVPFACMCTHTVSRQNTAQATEQRCWQQFIQYRWMDGQTVQCIPTTLQVHRDATAGCLHCCSAGCITTWCNLTVFSCTAKPAHHQSCLPPKLQGIIVYAMALLMESGADTSAATTASSSSIISSSTGTDSKTSNAQADVITTSQGLQAMNRHLAALGRFGDTAFLTPMYGVGELAQSFCRICAVNGGVYVLNRSLRSLLIDSNSGRCIGVIDSTGQ